MEHVISTHGLIAIFVLMVAESACVPVPSEVTMLLGGALSAGAVGDPHASLAAVIVAGTAGNVVGSYLAWLVGRYGGRPALQRWGHYVLLRPHHVDRAERWFTQSGASSVFWTRLLPGVRTLISLPAGMAAMAPLRFGVYTLAGCLPWTTALAVVGHQIGANWHSAEGALRGPSYLVAAATVLAMAGYLIVKRRNAKSRNAIGCGDPTRTTAH